MGKQRIAILVHRDDGPLTDASYLLTPILEAWKEAGHAVEFVLGPTPGVQADVLILHVNLTVIPYDYLEFASSFSMVVNGKVVDISKRRISRNLVTPGDGYEGPVIVKTNLNHGGKREAAAQSQPGDPLSWLHTIDVAPTSHYHIYNSPAEAPESAWTDDSLVVEKFLAEINDGLYTLRTWLFLGDREYNSVGYSKSPIIKGRGIVRRNDDQQVPDDLRRIRAEMDFDYGKFDYVVINGSSVLFDANRTPTLGNRPLAEYMFRGRHLAEGLYALTGPDAVR